MRIEKEEERWGGGSFWESSDKDVPGKLRKEKGAARRVGSELQKENRPEDWLDRLVRENEGEKEKVRAGSIGSWLQEHLDRPTCEARERRERELPRKGRGRLGQGKEKKGPAQLGEKRKREGGRSSGLGR